MGYSQISFDTSNFLFQDDVSGDPIENISKVSANIGKISTELENIIKSTTGGKGFLTDKNIVKTVVDAKSGNAKFLLNVQDRYLDLVQNTINEQLKSKISNMLNLHKDSSMDLSVSKLYKHQAITSKFNSARHVISATKELQELDGKITAFSPTEDGRKRYKITYWDTNQNAKFNLDKMLPATRNMLINEKKEKDIKDTAKAEEQKQKEEEKREKKFQADKVKEEKRIAKLEHSRKQSLYDLMFGADKANERGGKSSSRILQRMLLYRVIAGIFQIVDIARRLLVAVLANASQRHQENVSNRTLGLTYNDSLALKSQDKFFGNTEGTRIQAQRDITNAFGLIENQDDNPMINKLAPVLKSKIAPFITMGLANTQPEKLVEVILDSYKGLYDKGQNEFGQYVGKEASKRTLVTHLGQVSPALSELLSSFLNDTERGIYAGKADTWADYNNLYTQTKGGLAESEYLRFEELGQVVDSVTTKFKDFKEVLFTKLGLGLDKFINWINNSTLFMSESEQLAFYANNRSKNAEQALRLTNEKNALGDYMLKHTKEVYGYDFNSIDDLLKVLGGSQGNINKNYPLIAENFKKGDNRLFSSYMTYRVYEQGIKESAKQAEKDKSTFTEMTQNYIATQAKHIYMSPKYSLSDKFFNSSNRLLSTYPNFHKATEFEQSLMRKAVLNDIGNIVANQSLASQLLAQAQITYPNADIRSLNYSGNKGDTFGVVTIDLRLNGQSLDKRIQYELARDNAESISITLDNAIINANSN